MGVKKYVKYMLSFDTTVKECRIVIVKIQTSGHLFSKDLFMLLNLVISSLLLNFFDSAG